MTATPTRRVARTWGPGRTASAAGRAARTRAPFWWALLSPALIGLLIFLLAPILIVVWASFREWNGISPLGASEPAGAHNYLALVTQPGIRQEAFGTAVRNNLYYVLGVVPAQTILAFVLAFLVNERWLKGRGLFRTAFFIPSITGSVAMALVFTFLLRSDGLVNTLLPFGAVRWLDEPTGIGHMALSVVGADADSLSAGPFLGLTVWDWLSGPSVTLVAIMGLVVWQTTGTMMLIFLGALQEIPTEVDEAAAVDGAGPVRRFFSITVPMMHPAIAFVVTLGIIYTWQVFDQIYVITAGGPQSTTTTPAYLMYFQMFSNADGGSAAAIAVILFVIIIGFTLVQRVRAARR